jgi:hypothetical protein
MQFVFFAEHWLFFPMPKKVQPLTGWPGTPGDWVQQSSVR